MSELFLKGIWTGDSYPETWDEIVEPTQDGSYEIAGEIQPSDEFQGVID